MMDKDKITPAPIAERPMVANGIDIKAVREAKGISLRDIYLATRVTVAILEAIEEGRFQSLPEPVYARTFIKSYAKFLDIDSRPILEPYERYLQSLKYLPASSEDSGNQTEARQKNHKKYRMLMWAGVLLAVVLSLLYLICANDSKAPHLLSPQTLPPEKSVAVAQPDAPSGPGTASLDVKSPSIKEEAPPTPAEAGSPAGPSAGSLTSRAESGAKPEKRYRIVITAIEKTWLRIRDDQNQAQEMMLKPGEVMERFASDSFNLDIGNAGGLEIAFQGQSLGTLGKRGQVIHLKLP